MKNKKIELDDFYDFKIILIDFYFLAPKNP